MHSQLAEQLEICTVLEMQWWRASRSEVNLHCDVTDEANYVRRCIYFISDGGIDRSGRVEEN